MATTARLVVLLEPDEKASLKSRASAARLSMGEYVKRAVNAYGGERDLETEAELERLSAELGAAAKSMAVRLDTAIARLDAALDPKREAALRARLEAEARALPDTAIAGARELFGL